ncbi:hypothetical protein IFR05_010160 [Cadophora sp. M221]|nr:hypothetical protein IFR05_010160 [Cadophora sp. M221]
MTSLPTTRGLLTSLINTLTTTPPPPPSQNQANQRQPEPHQIINEPYDQPSNPLKALSPAHRALLSTMHVLFTPPMLLQALDLLDRGLVLRVIEELPQSALTGGNDDSAKVPGAGPEAGGGDVFPPQANIHLPSTLLLDSLLVNHRPRTETTLHQVRSSQPPKSRFRDASASSLSGSSGSNVYTVRLEAWNCSCAAFAFASFPAASIYPAKERDAWDLDLNSNRNYEDGTHGGVDVRMGGFEARVGGKERGERGGEEWEFGGLSLDGRNGGGVPCCKHLLACVLGERWDVLKGYVKERVVGREEMAGLGCEG